MGIFLIGFYNLRQLHSKKTLRLILTAILVGGFVFLPVSPALACCPSGDNVYDIVFNGRTIDTDTSTWSYTVYKTGDGPALSHWVWQPCFSDNLGERFVSAAPEPNGVGFDGSTLHDGVKWEGDYDWTPSGITFAITINGQPEIDSEGAVAVIKAGQAGDENHGNQPHFDLVIPGPSCHEPSQPTYAISGMKFNDENGNGIKDNCCESGLEEWTITIEGPDCFSSSTTTDEQGHYSFDDLLPGLYTVCEVQQDGWQQTYPTEDNGCHLIEVTSDDISGLNFGNQQIVPSEVTILGYKIVCQSEEDLPNWGAGTSSTPSMIDENTASEFLASHPDCSLESGWDFQWGFQDKQCTQGVDKLNGDHLGPADGTPSSCEFNCGPNTNTGTNYNDWKNFDSSTGEETPAMVTIDNLEEASGIWVRENLKQGYIPFTYPPQGPTEDDVSAEMYCHNDVYRYDNYDLVSSPELGETYYCIAFNAPVPPPVCVISGIKFNDLNENGLNDDEPGLENWTIQLKQAAACLESEEWADEVIEYNPGRKDDYSELDPERTNPVNALGPAQDDETLNFVSLGFNGELILKFDNLIINGSGNDIEVVETTYGSPDCQDYSEKVRLYASQTGQDGTWQDLGIGCLDSQFDLGSLAWAQYVKLVDETNLDDFGGVADGYDVDGVKALHCSGWEIIDTQITDEDGHYCFASVEPGDYRIEEILKAGWNNSTFLFQDVTVVEGEPITVDFGNYQIEEPYCGNGVLDPCEECDEGENNGVECTPEYGSTCTYCSLECDIIELTGPYCGDGNLDEGYEECDDGNTVDGDGCSATCQIEEEPPKEVSPGDIVINEIMQNPAAVSDTYGEWFELYNATSSPLELNGCVIRDNGTDSHAIATSSLVIPVGGYLVLARNGDPSQNGGVTPDYVYSSFILGNADDEIILECNQIEIDRVVYDDGTTFPDPTGTSMILAHPALDNNLGSNWCESSSSYGDGDLGTPGALNDSCQEIIGSMAGCKYHDANNNSLIDPEEEKLGGWTIILEKYDGQSWQELATTTTQLEGEGQGCYLFEELLAGDYRVNESLVDQTGWLQTYPTSTPYWEFTLEPGQNLSEIDFANYLSCTDDDGDDYAIEGGDCGPIDCDDTNPDVYPGATEICDNSLDDDCDQAVDCNDSNCSGDPACAPPGPGPAPPKAVAVGGGGGGGPTGLIIFNERTQEVQTDRATLTWFTNLSATSRVVYDTESHIDLANPLAIPPNYSYLSSTVEDSTKVTYHTVLVTELTPCTNYYWRAISHRSPEILGVEITFKTKCLPGEVPEEAPEEKIIEEEVIEEVPLEEKMPAEVEEAEKEIPLITEAEAEEILEFVEKEKPEEEKLEEEELEEEEPTGLLAAIGSLFRLDNFCWFSFLIILALVVLWLLLEARKKKEKKEEGLLLMLQEKKRSQWIFPLIIVILIILYSYFCCSGTWLLLLIIAILIALFFWYKKRKEKKEKV